MTEQTREFLRRVRSDSAFRPTEHDALQARYCEGQGWVRYDLHNCLHLTDAGEEALAREPL